MSTKPIEAMSTQELYEHCQQLEAKVKAIPESLEIAITELAYRKQEIRVKDELIQRAMGLLQPMPFRTHDEWYQEKGQWLADASKVVK